MPRLQPLHAAMFHILGQHNESGRRVRGDVNGCVRWRDDDVVSLIRLDQFPDSCLSALAAAPQGHGWEWLKKALDGVDRFASACVESCGGGFDQRPGRGG